MNTCLRLGVLALILGFVGSDKVAPAATWDGSTDNQFSDGTNWDVLPVSGNPWVFTSVYLPGGLNLNNNLTNAAFNVSGITFNSGSPAYVIGDGTGSVNSGNAFVLTGNIVNNSTSLQTINNPFSMTLTRQFSANSGNITLGGSITGTGGLLEKQGANVLLLNTTPGTNTYTGGTTINGGTLRLGANNQLPDTGTVTINGGTTLDLNGFNDTIQNIQWGGGSTKTITTGAGTLTLSGNISGGDGSRLIQGKLELTAGTHTIQDAGNGVQEISAAVSGAGGINFANVSVSRLLLSSSLSTFTGGVTTQASAPADTIEIGADSILSGPTLVSGPLGLGTFTFNNGALSSNSTTPRTIYNNVNQTSDAYIGTTDITRNGALTFMGTVTGNAGFQMQINSPVTFAGTIAGSVQKQGSSTLTISGTANSGVGFTINNGTLLIANATGLANSAVTLANTAGVILDVTGQNTTIGSLATGGASGGSVSLGSRTLTTGGNNSSTSYAGIISGVGGGITKTGTGTWTLSGNNTYTGTTTLAAGTISLGHANAIGTTGDVTFTGGTLQHGGSNSVDYSSRIKNSTGEMRIDTNGVAVTYANALDNTNTGGLNKLGSNTLTLSNTGNNYGGNTTVTAGTLRLGASNVIPDGSGFGNVTVSGTLDLNGNSETINGLSGGGTINSSVAGTPTLTVGNNNQTSSFTGLIQNGSGTVGLTKMGTGTLTLGNTANTYSGPTTINNGMLSVALLANGGSNSSIGASTSAAANLVLGGGTLRYTGGNATTNRDFTLTSATTSTIDVTVPANNLTISGGSAATSGALTKSGFGTLTLSGTNNHTGGTTVNQGTLVATTAASLPTSGTLSVGNGGRFSMVNGTAVNSYVTDSLSLVGGSQMAFDWVGAASDTLTSTNAATASGIVGIQLNPVSSPSGTQTLVSSPSGGLTTGGASYFLTNNVNYTATLTATDTAVAVGSYAAVSALSNAYWVGNKINGSSTAGIDNSMSLSNGTTSNWSSAAANTNTGLVPGSTTNVFFSVTSGATPTLQSNVVLGADMTVNTVTFSDTSPVTIGAGNLLTLNGNSGMTATESATVNAVIAFTANQTWNVASTKTLTVGGTILGGGSSLNKSNAGTLVLNSTPGTNAYTGGTTISGGTLRLGANDQLPDTGTVTLNNDTSTLDLDGFNDTIQHIAWGGGGAKLIKTGSGTLTLTGDIGAPSATSSKIEGNLALTAGSHTISDANTVLEISAAVSGPGSFVFNNAGTGRLLLSSNASTFTGGVVAQSGSSNDTIEVGANSVLSGPTLVSGPLGLGTFTFNNGGISSGDSTPRTIYNTVVQNGGQQAYLGHSTRNGALTFMGSVTGSGTEMQIHSPVTFAGNFNGSLTKSGNATLTLTANNNYTGGTTVNAGALNIQHANALGTTGGSTTINNNAALEIQGGIITAAESLSLTGTGVSNGGALRNISGNNTYTGAITIASGVRINSDSGTLTLDRSTGNAITGSNANVLFGGAGNVTVADPIATGTGTLTKDGAGTLTLGAVNTYTGVTNVNVGTLLVNGSTHASSALTVAPSATLGGTGTIGGAAIIRGTHSPGNSPGIQTFAGNLTYEDGGDPDPLVLWELVDNTVTNQPNPNALFDTIVVGGNLDFADPTALELSFDAGGSTVDWTDSFWATSYLGTSGWLLYDVAGTTSNFADLLLTTIDWLDSNALAFNTARPGSSFSLLQDGNDIYLNYNFVAANVVPEPSTFVLGLLGLAGLGLLAAARRRQSLC